MNQTPEEPSPAFLSRQWKPYPSYKPSGVEWLGEIPQKWQVIKLAFIANKITNGYVGPTRDIFVDDGVIYLQSLHIQENKIVFDNNYFVSHEWSQKHSKSILFKDDVLIVQTGGIGNVAVVTPEFEGANCHALIIVSPKKETIEGKYLSWVLNSSFGLHSLKSLQTGALHPHLNCGEIRDIKVPIPPIAEQKQIARFLDRETTRIDTLITKKRQLIALLQKKRDALIHQAVTQGLDPTVPLKNSGITAIGKIPEHWRRIRLGYFSCIGNGSTPKRDDVEYWSSDDFPWLNSGKINESIIYSADQYISEKALKECHLPIVSANSVLVAITGEGQTRGRSALLKFDSTINQHLAYITPNPQHFEPEYLWRQLQTFYKWLRDESGGSGSTRAAITCEFLKSMEVVVPEIREQIGIVERINQTVQLTEISIQKTRLSVEYLEGYRQALITAAVTGKIDVREKAEP